MERQKYKVLVVDDNEAMRNLIVAVLSGVGHHCTAAINGNDALAKASENKFDAVITDIRMPGMDGITLTKELSKQYDTLPIMILTGYDDQYSAETAIAAGAQEFIKKPFSVDEFLLRFHMMMRDHEMLSTLEAKKNEIIFKTNTEFMQKIEGLQRQIGNDSGKLTSKYPPL
jgi:CheY-like chemotaxis protein